MNITIEHDKKNHQFFSMVEGKKALLDYTILPDGKTLDYYHTYVPPELRGHEIAGNIVKFALDYAVENHYRVIPSCSYVHSYIKRHLEYQDLVVE
ncbi:MAG: N-acetyltransferase [Alphaproteobacteria bacterium]|nr:N-acetyltransferase [Alphaproteobacteria bacterium]